MPLVFTCEWCKKEFESYLRKGKPKKFCSTDCYAHARTGVPNPFTGYLKPISCLQCQKVFKPSMATIRFCSVSCASIWSSHPDKRGQGDVLKRACSNCGKMFRKRLSKRFCSATCSYEGKRGEKNAGYKGGKSTDERGYIRFSDAHPEHSGKYGHQVVWDAANPKQGCERCGGRKEVVHHKDENTSNNALENLMGLCRPCHQIVHAKMRRESHTLV